MNKMSVETIQQKIKIMLATKKKRKFLETVELQILLQVSIILYIFLRGIMLVRIEDLMA